MSLSLSLIVIYELFNRNFVLADEINSSSTSEGASSGDSFMGSKSLMLLISSIFEIVGSWKETSTDFFRSMRR